jgi:hypothetical protein
MHKLRNSSKGKIRHSRTSLKEARLNTNVLKEEFDHGLQILDKIRKEREQITSEIKSEVLLQIQLKEKIDFLKREYKLLKTTHEANSIILTESRSNRSELEEQVKQLESYQKRIVRTIDQSSATPTVLKSRGSYVIENNFSKLFEVVNANSKENQKEKSILLTCLKELIDTTDNNEFSDFKWKTKLAYSPKGLGAKIRFENLSIRPNDMKVIYKPIITRLGERFKNMNLILQVKTKKNNGVVEVLDFTVKLPYLENSPVSSIRESHF